MERFAAETFQNLFWLCDVADDPLDVWVLPRVLWRRDNIERNDLAQCQSQQQSGYNIRHTCLLSTAFDEHLDQSLPDEPCATCRI